MGACMANGTTFGERLLELRREAGLSAEKLARGLGLHRNSVFAYERNTKVPALSLLAGLDAAGLDWIYALRGEKTDVFVADRIDWDVVLEIVAAIEQRREARTLSAAQKKALLQVVYRTEVATGRGVAVLVDEAMEIAG